ncbi:MAG: amidohydrolase [Planctomycetia bacterium]|nr:amidohydrolase [Planctomycetia bacterium]
MRSALLLIIATAIVLTATATSRSDEKPADLIVVNAKVLAVDARFSQAAALAVRDGKFLAVGTSAEIRKLAGEKTRVIDAKGRTVVPGLIETHVHAAGAARGEVLQPFVQLGSIAEIQDWVRKQAKKQPGEAWIQTPRADVTRIRERRMPTKTELDEAAPDRPVVFNWQYANRQVQVLSSAALKAAGITADTKAPGRGKIHLGDDGRPNGVLENAGPLVAKFLTRPDVPEEKYLESLERLLRRYNELGITSIFERNSNVAGYRTYEKLKAQDRLPIRVTVTIGLGSDGSVEGTERFIRSLPFKFGDGDERLKVGPLKIGVDGGVLYGTAYLREPYGQSAFSLYGIDDPEYRGDLRWSAEKIANMIRTGHRLGWQMCSHVTGDAGVDAVLDAVESAHEDSPIDGRRYTLIHAYFPNEETARRAARLGVCVDTQPAWYYKDGDALAAALGAARLEKFIGLNVWRSAGVKVALNSDHMQGFGPDSSLNPFNPFLTMYVAISRRMESGRVIGHDQRVSREEALRMTTIDAAWLSFDEPNRGSIEPGKLADFAILSDDFLNCPEERIKEIRSVLTAVGGKVVYEAKNGRAEK